MNLGLDCRNSRGGQLGCYHGHGSRISASQEPKVVFWKTTGLNSVKKKMQGVELPLTTINDLASADMACGAECDAYRICAHGNPRGSRMSSRAVRDLGVRELLLIPKTSQTTMDGKEERTLAVLSCRLLQLSTRVYSLRHHPKPVQHVRHFVNPRPPFLRLSECLLQGRAQPLKLRLPQQGWPNGSTPSAAIPSTRRRSSLE